MSDTSDTPNTKPKKAYFRASIIYNGKHAGRSGCAFVRAVSKDEAHDFIVSTLKKNGYHEDSCKVEISSSSKEEIEFYVQNRKVKGYTGIVN